ncbi:MAG TPA: hypothetical protein VJ719_16015 [Chthoniobacterales bacterium]|nr:hypothetical protein [Chthoniobacterales bacterium]
MWRRHHIESLLEGAARSFTDKIRMLEQLEGVARAFHGGRLPHSADEHDEQSGTAKA